MSTYVRMKKKRDIWKVKTVESKANCRYHLKEKNRIKCQRNQLKVELHQARQTIKELESRNKIVQIYCY